MDIVSIIVYIAINIIVIWLVSYLQQKGKNLATKEDVANITRQVEAIKSDVKINQSIELSKWQLKHDACLESLSIIDAVFSQMSWKDLRNGKDLPVTKQKIDIEKARGCHNRLILSCENIKTVDKFTEILFDKSENKTKLLNEYRNLVREELNFGKNRALDETLAWIGFLSGAETTL